MNDEWALQTTFAGAISQQVGFDLIQCGQGGATGTTARKAKNVSSQRETDLR